MRPGKYRRPPSKTHRKNRNAPAGCNDWVLGCIHRCRITLFFWSPTLQLDLTAAKYLPPENWFAMPDAKSRRRRRGHQGVGGQPGRWPRGTFPVDPDPKTRSHKASSFAVIQASGSSSVGWGHGSYAEQFITDFDELHKKPCIDLMLITPYSDRHRPVG